MNTQLKPCPFCGGEAEPHCDYIRDGRQVICGKCFARGPAVFHGPSGLQMTAPRAVEAWNRRTPSEPLAFDAEMMGLR